MFSFSEIDANALIDVAKVDFAEGQVTLDLNFAQSSMGIFNFDLEIGSKFSLISAEFNDDLNDSGFMIHNYDEPSDTVFVSVFHSVIRFSIQVTV